MTAPNTPNPDVPSREEQRADLADTVAALAAKADVPTRVSNEASLQAARASEAVKNNQSAIAGIVGALVAGLIVTTVIRRRRARKVWR